MVLISGLTSASSAANADLIELETAGGASRKITRAAFISGTTLPTGTTLPPASVTNAMLSTASGEPGGAWQSYTPSWTSSGTAPVLGNGILTGYYKDIGNTRHFRIRLVLGSTTTGGTGVYAFSLPGAAAATMFTSDPVGSVHVEDTGVASTVGVATIGLTLSQIRLWIGSGLVSATSPYTFGNTDAIRVSGTYEKA